MTETAQEKYSRLVSALRSMKAAVLAFSGGADSTLLLVAGQEALGDRLVPVVGVSATYPARERAQAVAIAERLGVQLRLIGVDELGDSNFTANPNDRCFHCKQHLLSKLIDMARREGIECVIDGANADDLGDYRPGIEAASLLGVRHPLIMVGMTKADIRTILKEKGLPNWDRPSQACLASRIPYGREITVEKLQRIEAAEDRLLALGFRQVRVRDWGHLAVIEVGSDETDRLFAPEMRRQVVEAVLSAGYKRVALDPQGYSTGSLNLGLPR